MRYEYVTKDKQSAYYIAQMKLKIKKPLQYENMKRNWGTWRNKENVAKVHKGRPMSIAKEKQRWQDKIELCVTLMSPWCRLWCSAVSVERLESRDRRCPPARPLCHGTLRLARPRFSPDSTASITLRSSSADNINTTLHPVMFIRKFRRGTARAQ